MERWLTLAAMACLPALATAQSIRCADKIISTGTTRAQVAALCGDPAQVDHKSVFKGIATAVGGQQNSVANASVEIQIEVWTYNFGPNKLMQRIRFEDGVIVRIESLGYGY